MSNASRPPDTVQFILANKNRITRLVCATELEREALSAIGSPVDTRVTIQTIGHMGEHPICVALFPVETPDGEITMFYEVTSRVSDELLIKQWAMSVFPQCFDGPHNILTATQLLKQIRDRAVERESTTPELGQ